MVQSYWRKQTTQAPLFPQLLWSRPENRALAGKLLIIGGNLHGFAATATAYAASEQAGTGTARVLLPDVLQKTVQKLFSNSDFAPSTPSGSFSKSALAMLLDLSTWADGILLAGDFGKNSETAMLLEKYATDFDGPITLTGDGIDYFITSPEPLLERSFTTLVPSFTQLQHLVSGAHHKEALTADMDLLNFLQLLHDFSVRFQASLVMSYRGYYIVAVKGQLTTTPLSESKLTANTAIASWAAVMRNQYPADKTLESLTCAGLLFNDGQ